MARKLCAWERVPPLKSNRTKAVEVISAVKLAKAVRKGCSCFAVVVQPATEVQSSSHAWSQLEQSVLEEYRDVFPQDLPKGVPPERGVVHTIPLMPDSTPPFRRLYRLSPLELQEAEG